MLFVDKYFQVVEKESFLVSRIWKAYHLLSLLGVAVCSFIVGYCFPHILAGFGNHCIFGAKIEFRALEDSYTIIGNFSQNASFYNKDTFWGKQGSCSYVGFFFIFNSIVAMIVLAFFLIVSKGGAAESYDLYSSPWRIIVPALAISIVMSIWTLVALIQLKVGLQDFCSQFEPVLDSITCPESLDDYTLIFYKSKHRVSCYIALAKATALATFICWVALVCSLLFRLIRGVDFKIIVYDLQKVKPVDGRSSSTSASITELQVDDDEEIPMKVTAKMVEGVSISGPDPVAV